MFHSKLADNTQQVILFNLEQMYALAINTYSNYSQIFINTNSIILLTNKVIRP